MDLSKRLRQFNNVLGNEQAYTLLEMLIVLTIWSVGISLTVTGGMKVWNQHQYNMFINQFSTDILYLQQQTMTKREELRLFLYPQHSKYEIREGGLANVLIKRKIPKEITVELLTLTNTIRFDKLGRIVEPGSLLIKLNDAEYKLTFPFGKGRFYVYER